MNEAGNLYQIVEYDFDDNEKRNAQSKARVDVTAILNRIGAKEIVLCPNNGKRKSLGIVRKALSHVDVYRYWKEKTEDLVSGDVLVVQFPVLSHSLLFWRVMAGLSKRGVRVILLLHDLELIRTGIKKGSGLLKRARINTESKSPLKRASCIITHNALMTETLSSLMGDAIRKRCVSIELFDYITGFQPKSKVPTSHSVIIAGNLSPDKAGYLQKLPSSIPFKLYGNGYLHKEGDSNISYLGSFPPDELPSIIDGSFGLVWDGPSVATCSGVYGQYLKVNNPHKTSLYLAAGIPVIVWSEAAIASFVKKEGVGSVVDSLLDLDGVLEGLDSSKYESMRKAAEMIGAKIRSGFYTESAIDKCIKAISTGTV